MPSEMGWCQENISWGMPEYLTFPVCLQKRPSGCARLENVHRLLRRFGYPSPVLPEALSGLEEVGSINKEHQLSYLRGLCYCVGCITCI
jgi:hypothetical protein